MKFDELRKQWLEEEKVAHINGWDFSHINGRYEEENDLPWDYESIVKRYLTPEKRILDIDTGGGEFLLSLNHPFENTSATEAYPPNVRLCMEKLLPLGIDFREGDGSGLLPFPDEAFDIIINRHGTYTEKEIVRLLKKEGFFITQQVGAENDRYLVEMILTKAPEVPFPEQYLDKAVNRLRQLGFTIIEEMEAYRPIRFYDVGALVWFARIIEWEFPDFSVDNNFANLLNAQSLLEKNGSIEGKIHRYLLVVRNDEKLR